MIITINIDRSKVYKEVDKTTAYEGAHSGAFDNVHAKPEDEEMLKRYWNEGVSFITNVIKKYAGEITNNNSSYIATLDMPSNYDEKMAVPMNEAAHSFMCNYITAKWLEMLSMEKTKNYNAAATAQLAEMKSLLLHRVAPKRPE